MDVYPREHEHQWNNLSSRLSPRNQNLIIKGANVDKARTASCKLLYGTRGLSILKYGTRNFRSNAIIFDLRIEYS